MHLDRGAFTARATCADGHAFDSRSVCQSGVSVDRITPNQWNEADAVENVKRFRLAIAFVLALFAMLAVLYPMLPAITRPIGTLRA